MADQVDDAAEVLSQDTTYVFDAGEARVLVPLIDESFRPTDHAASAGNRAGGSRDYLEAHDELRTSIATLLGTTVNKLDLQGTKGNNGPAEPDEAAEEPVVEEPVVQDALGGGPSATSSTGRSCTSLSCPSTDPSPARSATTTRTVSSCGHLESRT